MIYVARREHRRSVLIEMPGTASIAAANAWNEDIHCRVTAEYARQWVREGKLHETGLYINDDGKVRYNAAHIKRYNELDDERYGR